MAFNKILSSVLICAIAALSLTSNAEQKIKSSTQSNSDNIPLYLPINRDQFPDLIRDFQSALEQAKANTPHLNRLELTTTEYWHPYQNGIRQGRLGIFFVAPHFASWLVNVHEFLPALRLSGVLQYVIAVRHSDSHLFELRDLADKTVCVSGFMDMSSLLVADAMSASLVPAKTQQVNEVAIEMKRNNQGCDAFSLSEHVFSQLSAEDPFQFIRLYQSKEFSNYGFLLHPEVPLETKEALRKLLLRQEIQEILNPMYGLFAKDPILLNAKGSHYPLPQMQPLTPYWRRH